MRIIIDMQGAQTESRFRGIGRYTMSFAQAIARNRGEHDVILALNGLLPAAIESIRDTFTGLLPQKNIRVWHAPGPVMESYNGNDRRREVAELVREAFLANLRPDIIHLSSLFEGYEDDAVTSIGRFDSKTPVSVTLYDLIPLLSPEHYLTPHPQYKQYYQRKIVYFKRGMIYLAISECSRQEGLKHLNIPESWAFNVSTAIEPLFQPLCLTEIDANRLRNKFGLTAPFVLYTGGCDQRKNLPRLIQAFASLPASLRTGHQLLLAGKIPKDVVTDFRNQAVKAGLKPDSLCFTGYVTDSELVQLCNLCKLFVFPSWHEGFGLPALEAMACSTPVIAACTASLPETIGLAAALFDPFDVSSLSTKMAQALEDDSFRNMLREHGLRQAKKFSWDETAKRALAAWATRLQTHKTKQLSPVPAGCKPKLIIVSPLPPERSGIADYSAELLPALAAYYKIEVVVAQDNIDTATIGHHCTIRDLSWFRSHAHEFDRVLYQVGNSPFHQYMLKLLQDAPGIVVLHDFFMSGLMSWMELNAGFHGEWTKALYLSHGYGAVRSRYKDLDAAKLIYPANFHVLQYAQGVIVHSLYSRKLGQQWYGVGSSDDWECIPLLRSPAMEYDKAAARQLLGINENDFLVCSFGFLDPSKNNHRLLKCWLNSPLAKKNDCQLVFVGENHGGNYDSNLRQRIHSSGLENRIRITGFVSSELYRQYLAAADMAVQLRTNSRGETSAAVFDCMNYALPLIVNAHGSIAEMDADTVWMLPDEFDDVSLINALVTLWSDPERRNALGKRARQQILANHTPAECARRYATAIERFHHQALTGTPALIKSIASQELFKPNHSELKQLAKTISNTLPLKHPAKRLYLDVTVTCCTELKTGIERVARALLLALLDVPPAGYRVEPVYLSNNGGEWHYRYARHYTLGLLGCPPEILNEDRVEPENGDVLLGLDLSGHMLVEASQAGLFTYYRNQGVLVYSIVFDLLPVRMREVFPPGADENYTHWLKTVAMFDGTICISKTTADDLTAWLAEVGFDWKNRRPYQIGWFHLGADIMNSAPSQGLPEDAESTLNRLRAHPSFLMVGTIEPRKGYLQTIEAFRQLWNDGIDVNLVIVGKEGWKDLPDAKRRDIPTTISLLQTHPECNKKLFWLEGISDEYLEKIYTTSTCLIAASFGEGFGLPLIEAAKHNLPIIARDIPVYREVAEKHAFFFTANSAVEMAAVVHEWLTLYAEGKIPLSENMPHLTWKQSAEELIQFCFKH